MQPSSPVRQHVSILLALRGLPVQCRLWEEVLKEQRRAVTMQILSEAIQIAEEMYSDVKGEARSAL